MVHMIFFTLPLLPSELIILMLPSHLGPGKSVALPLFRLAYHYRLQISFYLLEFLFSKFDPDAHYPLSRFLLFASLFQSGRD